MDGLPALREHRARLVSSRCHCEAARSHGKEQAARNLCAAQPNGQTCRMGGGRNMKKQSKRDWRVRRLKQTGARTSAALRHGTMEGWTCPRAFFQKRKQGRQLGSSSWGCLAPGREDSRASSDSPARTARKARDARALAHFARCPHLYSCRSDAGTNAIGWSSFVVAQRWGGDADKQEHELLPGARLAAGATCLEELSARTAVGNATTVTATSSVHREAARHPA